MDELKLLIELVSNLPSLAVWVLIGYLVYKVAVVGSIYGVARLAIEKLHSWLITRKAREVEYKDIRPMLDGICIRAQTDVLIGQIMRLRGRGTSGGSEYIHSCSVDWLREAIDDKIAKEQK